MGDVLDGNGALRPSHAPAWVVKLVADRGHRVRLAHARGGGEAAYCTYIRTSDVALDAWREPTRSRASALSRR